MATGKKKNNKSASHSKRVHRTKVAKEAKENKALSALPVIWTDIKKDELVNIYSKGTQKEKEDISTMMSDINPSQSNSWNQIKNSK